MVGASITDVLPWLGEEVCLICGRLSVSGHTYKFSDNVILKDVLSDVTYRTW